MSEATALCKNCDRPIRKDWQPPFMEQDFGYFAIYHDDDGDPLFCWPLDDARFDEAEEKKEPR